MTTAAQVQEGLTRYRQLNREIESIKHNLVGGGPFPVDDQRWTDWKNEQARQCGLDADHSELVEISNDPTYQRLLALHEESWSIMFDLECLFDWRVEENTLNAVYMSFPSLSREPLSLDIAHYLYEHFYAGEDRNPQAYHAALFVFEILMSGREYPHDIPRFFLDKAFDVWNDAYKEAYMHWATMPFFPPCEFARISVRPPKL